MNTKQKEQDNMTIQFIEPGQAGFVDNIGRRGKEDVVSPHLNPKILAMLDAGETSFQLADKSNGGPFTIAQVRYWQTRGNALLPPGKRISVSGGKGENIRVDIVNGIGAVRDGVKVEEDIKVEAPRTVKKPARVTATRNPKPRKRPAAKKTAK